MSSTNRKRKSTTTHEKEGRLSKRAKFLSSLWASQEEIEESIATSSTSTSKSAYRIKAIIGERPGEYLIDWADDPSTGRKFKADWVSEMSSFCFLSANATTFLQSLRS